MPWGAHRCPGKRGKRRGGPRPDARCSRTITPVYGEGYVSSSARPMGSANPQNAHAAGLYNSNRLE